MPKSEDFSGTRPLLSEIKAGVASGISFMTFKKPLLMPGATVQTEQ